MTDQVMDYVTDRHRTVVRAPVAAAAASAVDRTGAVQRPLCAGCAAGIRARCIAGSSKASSIRGSRTSSRDRNYRAPESEKKLRRLKASYYGLMSEVDDNLGRLFAHLKATGQYDDTLIVFTSDHGEQMGDHWLLGKCGYFEQSYHIPLIVRDPRASADATRGRTVDAFTENVDIMPTMLEWLGIDAPHACDGRSLIPFLRVVGAAGALARQKRIGNSTSAILRTTAQSARWEYRCTRARSTCIRGERYKYVHFAGLPPLLFDLHDDPHEFRNRAEDPAYLPVGARICAEDAVVADAARRSDADASRGYAEGRDRSPVGALVNRSICRSGWERVTRVSDPG